MRMQQRKTETFTYNLIRAKRRSMSLRVDEDGTVTVRAPYRMAAEEADRFVENHSEWIRTRLAGYERLRSRKRTYTEAEREAGRKLAREMLGEKCRYFAARMGVTYGTVSIREQKTRWGSCSVKGNLNFNWKLALMPGEISDYLVVHELAHRIEMNHSPAFWRIVEREIPDYRERRAWLKKNGAEY